ncbi:MAG: type II secretion system F family protein [Burkholderiaceae bacterium]
MTGLQILYLALVFVTVAAAVLAVGLAFGRRDPVRDRLRRLSADDGPGASQSADWHRRVVRVATPVARLATPSTDAELGRLRMRFLNAGIRTASAPVLFFACKTVLALGLPLGFYAFGRGFAWTPATGLGGLLLLAAAGYYLPGFILARLTAIRQRELFEAFPDALDLMIVCVEAGLGLDMAINRTAAELKLRSPVLAEELELMAIELRVGSSRERALRNLATRTGVEEIGSFATMLIQAERFGTSLADSLRVQADMLRTRRRLRAEEVAARIPLKLLFPLVFCIFPSLLLVLLGPAFLQVYRTLPFAAVGGG